MTAQPITDPAMLAELNGTDQDSVSDVSQSYSAPAQQAPTQQPVDKVALAMQLARNAPNISDSRPASLLNFKGLDLKTPLGQRKGMDDLSDFASELGRNLQAIPMDAPLVEGAEALGQGAETYGPKIVESISNILKSKPIQAVASISKLPVGAANTAKGLLTVNKDIDNFVGNITSGAENAEENLEGAASVIKKSRANQEKTALKILKPVTKAVGDDDITTIPDVSKYQPATTEQIISKYEEPYKIPSSTGNPEIISKILERHGEPSPGPSVLPEIKNDSYIQNYGDFDFREKILQDANDKYLKNTTFNNANDLRRSIGRRIGDFRSAKKIGGLLPADDEYLSQLEDMYSHISQNQNDYLTAIDPKLAEANTAFKNYWEKNVQVYNENPLARAITRPEKVKGTTQTIVPTPEELGNTFSFPKKDPSTVTILNHAGEELKPYLIHNALLDTDKSNIQAISSKLTDLARNKGYSKIITPDIEQKAKDLAYKKSLRDILTVKKHRGKILSGGSVLGILDYMLHKSNEQ